MKLNRALTTKQKGFIKWMNSEECFDNRTESARRAGYKGSDASLAQIGYENMKKLEIRAAIDSGRKEIFAGADVTIENILIDLQRIGKTAEAACKYSAAAYAAVQQGKYLKMFTNRIEKARTIEDYSDVELIQGLREHAEYLGIDLEPMIAGYIAKGGLDPDVK